MFSTTHRCFISFKQKPAPDLQTTTQPRCNRTLASACRTPCFDSAPRVKFCAVKGRCERGEMTFWRFLVVLKEIFGLFCGIFWEILVDCSGLKRKNEPFLKSLVYPPAIWRGNWIARKPWFPWDWDFSIGYKWHGMSGTSWWASNQVRDSHPSPCQIWQFLIYQKPPR